jgi:integrase
MAFLRKRNKTWHLIDVHATPRERSLRTTDRATALDYLANYQKNGSRARLGLPINDVSWSKFTTTYLDYSKTNKRPRSYTKDCFVLKDFHTINPIEAVAEFDNMKLERYKSYLLERGCGVATINRYLNTLTNCGTKISEWYHKDNPAKGVKRIKDVRKTRVRYFTEDELKRLFKQFKSYSVWEVASTISLYSGLRREEVCFLQWKDVDFSSGLLSVTAKPEYNWQPKSYQERTNPMAKRLLSYLNGYFRRVKPKDLSEWVCQSKGPKRLDSMLLTAMFKKFVQKAGIKGVSFHNLRKTNATKLADSGASASFLMRWLGHNSLSPVMVYMGIGEDHKREMVSKIDFSMAK